MSGWTPVNPAGSYKSSHEATSTTATAFPPLPSSRQTRTTASRINGPVSISTDGAPTATSLPTIDSLLNPTEPESLTASVHSKESGSLQVLPRSMSHNPQSPGLWSAASQLSNRTTEEVNSQGSIEETPELCAKSRDWRVKMLCDAVHNLNNTYLGLIGRPGITTRSLHENNVFRLGQYISHP